MSESNKTVALAWFEALVKGDADKALGLTHPDFRYFLPGSMPVSGWTDLEGFLGTTVVLADVLAGPVAMEIGDVVAEGDRVFIEAQGDAPLKSGERYRNVYVIALRVSDGKIIEFKEFSDTLHVYQVMDHPQVRGPAKPRERHLKRVTATWAGAGVGEPGS